MKFVALAENLKKNRSDWQVEGYTEYVVKVPNYMSFTVETLLTAVRKKVERTELGKEIRVVSGNLYGDAALTHLQKNQADFESKEIHEPIEIPLNQLHLEKD